MIPHRFKEPFFYEYSDFIPSRFGNGIKIEGVGWANTLFTIDAGAFCITKPYDQSSEVVKQMSRGLFAYAGIRFYNLFNLWSQPFQHFYLMVRGAMKVYDLDNYQTASPIIGVQADLRWNMFSLRGSYFSNGSIQAALFLLISWGILSR
jgi:hypothetical protein